LSDNAVFYAKGRNRGNERKIILAVACSLVGKAPTKQKRIKMKVRIPISSDKKQGGVPEWITNAYVFVAKNHDTVQSDVDLKGYDITFSDDNLFDKAGVKATKCDMRLFVIEEAGDAEEPDIQMTFVIYAPFTTNLWKWCGQMVGEEFWAKFEAVAPEPEEEGDDLELESDEESSGSEPEEGEEESGEEAVQ
jgi:hypothetical protein